MADKDSISRMLSSSYWTKAGYISPDFSKVHFIESHKLELKELDRLNLTGVIRFSI